MAYASNGIIKPDDLGKTLTNGNAEIANYNVFAVSVKETKYANRLFTFLFSRGNGTEFPAMALNSSSVPQAYIFTITISGNTFSVSGKFGSTTVSCSIQQIRGIV